MLRADAPSKNLLAVAALLADPACTGRWPPAALSRLCRRVVRLLRGYLLRMPPPTTAIEVNRWRTVRRLLRILLLRYHEVVRSLPVSSRSAMARRSQHRRQEPSNYSIAAGASRHRGVPASDRLVPQAAELCGSVRVVRQTRPHAATYTASAESEGQVRRRVSVVANKRPKGNPLQPRGSPSYDVAAASQASSERGRSSEGSPVLSPPSAVSCAGTSAAAVSSAPPPGRPCSPPTPCPAQVSRASVLDQPVGIRPSRTNRSQRGGIASRWFRMSGWSRICYIIYLYTKISIRHRISRCDGRSESALCGGTGVRVSAVAIFRTFEQKLLICQIRHEAGSEVRLCARAPPVAESTCGVHRMVSGSGRGGVGACQIAVRHLDRRAMEPVASGARQVPTSSASLPNLAKVAADGRRKTGYCCYGRVEGWAGHVFPSARGRICSTRRNRRQIST